MNLTDDSQFIWSEATMLVLITDRSRCYSKMRTM